MLPSYLWVIFILYIIDERDLLHRSMWDDYVEYWASRCWVFLSSACILQQLFWSWDQCADDICHCFRRMASLYPIPGDMSRIQVSWVKNMQVFFFFLIFIFLCLFVMDMRVHSRQCVIYLTFPLTVCSLLWYWLIFV